MKKNVFQLSVVVLFATILLAGCAKYEVSTPLVVDQNQKATISGVAYAILNEFDDIDNGDPQFAPSGTKIMFSVDGEDLTGVDGANDIIVTVTVGANGVYTASVPVNNLGVAVTVLPQDFAYDFIPAVWDAVDMEWVEGDAERQVYEVAPFQLNLKTGEGSINDFMYAF